MFGQTFEFHDLIVIGVLVVLEGVLSIDNALVLGLLARRLPKRLRPRALSYGLIGAFVFRVIAIVTAGFLLQWKLPKLLGGLYLIYVAVKHFISGSEEHHEPDPDHHHEVDVDHPEHAQLEAKAMTTHSRLFWTTVGVIELTDIAFAVDSIVAAVGLVAPDHPPGQRFHPKLWLVVAGGMLGVIVMRFAAVLFIKLLEKFPRFETSAYLLVIVIGMKLVLDYFFQLNFHSPSELPFWIFWILMIACFAMGFVPQRKGPEPAKGDPAAPGASP
jgi:YkoY family integral membrane protein